MNYDCTIVDMTFFDRGATKVPWDSINYGWVNLPPDLDLKQTIDFPDDGGIWEYESPSTGRRFLLWYWSYEPSAASDGSHNGNHHFCGMYELGNSSE